jgi:hypothetical protein
MRKDGCPANAVGAEAATCRSGACARPSWRSGVFVLWHAAAADWTAMRHPLRHALSTVRLLDPARPLVPIARSAAPHLAACLRGCSGTSAGWLSGPSPAKPLPAVEHHLRTLETPPHRVRCDCLHLHPRAVPKAPCRRGSERPTSTTATLDICRPHTTRATACARPRPW